MTAAAEMSVWLPTDASIREWGGLSTRAPRLVASMHRYLVQCTTFLGVSCHECGCRFGGRVGAARVWRGLMASA